MELTTAVPHAQGATGRVLRARDQASGRDVAIKVLRADDPLWAQRMARESDALRRLRHPHICPILDVTEYDGQPALVLPFIDGEPLDRALRDAPLETRLAAMRDVVAAVQAAHHDGIVHRDLKPGNVLVERRGDGFHPWVLDFGLARAVDDDTLTLEGQVLGTPGYLAPEQAEGRPADERSDIYGLGVMLFELLTGRRPHEGETSAEILLATVSRDAPSVRSLDPRIPVALARVVAQCIERNPRLRYGSARALHDDLQAVSEGRPVSARGIGPIYRLRRLVVGSPVLGSAVATAAVAVAIAGWIAFEGAERQAAVAAESRELEQQVSAVERELQLVYVQPVHDIRAEVAALTDEALDRANAIARVNTGPVAASAQAAVGRLYLAIGDHRSAIEPLERAYYAGLRDTALVRRLGEAYARSYLAALEQARRRADDRAFAEARAALEEELGEPARRFLREAESDAAVVSALRARLDGNTEEALAVLAAVPDGTWPIPAWLLDLQLGLDEVARLIREGRFEPARALLDAADGRLAAITDRARSHPEVRRIACRRDGFEIDLAMAGVAERDLSLSHCEVLRRIDPQRLSHRITAAEAYAKLARHQRLVGDNPQVAIDATLGWIGESSDDPALQGQLGAALFVQGIYRQQFEGRLAIELFEQAAAVLEAALAEDPANPDYLADLGSVLEQLGSARYLAGEDGDPDFARAIDRLSAAVDRNPDYLSITRKLVSLLMWRGYERYIRGRDAEAILAEAVSRAQAAAGRWPDSAGLHATWGMAARTLGEYRLLAGEDPTSASEMALQAFDRSLEIQPESFAARFNQIGVPMIMIRHALLERERPAAPWIDRLDVELEALAGLVDDPDEFAAQTGIRHALAARVALAEGAWPESEIARARERLAIALGSEWDRLPALVSIGALARDQHREALRAGRLDRARLREDLDLLSAGLAENPTLHELRIYRADLLELCAAAGIDAGIHAADPEQERVRALAGNPRLSRFITE